MNQTPKPRLFIALSMLVPLVSTSLAQASTKSSSLGIFELTAYERIETYAGKQGNRIKEKLTLKQNGKTYTLSFARYHTRVAGQTIKPYCPGCPIEVKKGRIVKATIVAERSDVVQLHERDSKGHVLEKS